MKRRRGYGTFSTSVDVEIDVIDVLEELTDDDLRTECKHRNIPVGAEAIVSTSTAAEAWRDFAEELRDARTDGLHFEVMIVRMLAIAGVPPLKIPVKS